MSVINCTDGCPCMEPCPVLYAMKKLSGKWKVPILCALNLNGSTRYNTLLRKVTGITNTMLASSLKELEDDGLVARKEYLEVPVRVEYCLTERYEELRPALDAIQNWGRMMIKKDTAE